MADLSIGAVATGTGNWDGDAADGMVILTGDSARCPTSQGIYYGESVMVQRGADQTTDEPDHTRCGQLLYWDGTGYTPVDITDEGWDDPIDTAPVTWTSVDGTITATTQVQVLPAYVDNPEPVDPNCRTSACTASVSAGTIVIVSTYDIVWPSHEFVLIVSTVVVSPSAQASYTAAPGAS
jgi:hypothetical protein